MKIRKELNEFRRLSNAKFEVVLDAIRDLQKTYDEGFKKLEDGLGKEVEDIKKRLDDAGL